MATRTTGILIRKESTTLARSEQRPRARSTALPNAAERPEPLVLLRALQRSLEPSVVVATFASHLLPHFDLEGFAFRHREFGMREGDRQEHAFATRLRLENTLLGELEVYRNRAFAPRERAELRALAELLLHPLRNAIVHASLQKQACEDSLTGLLNRHALERVLPREMAAAKHTGRPLTAVAIDMDRLKEVNDTWGHAAGDQMLVRLARAISSVLRCSDLTFRIGGDEFVLLLPATSAAGAARVVARIRQALCTDTMPSAAHSSAPGMSLAISFSAGISTSHRDSIAADLLATADQAMYAAKRSARMLIKNSPDLAALT